MLSVLMAKSQQLGTLDESKQEERLLKRQLRRSMEREELAAKSELRRSQWLEIFKQTPDLLLAYQNGSVTYRHPNQFKLRESDMDYLARDNTSPIRLNKPRFYNMKNYQAYAGERQSKVEQKFSESVRFSTKDRYQGRTLNDVEIYRSTMKN